MMGRVDTWVYLHSALMAKLIWGSYGCSDYVEDRKKLYGYAFYSV